MAAMARAIAEALLAGRPVDVQALAAELAAPLAAELAHADLLGRAAVRGRAAEVADRETPEGQQSAGGPP